MPLHEGPPDHYRDESVRPRPQIYAASSTYVIDQSFHAPLKIVGGSETRAMIVQTEPGQSVTFTTDYEDPPPFSPQRLVIIDGFLKNKAAPLVIKWDKTGRPIPRATKDGVRIDSGYMTVLCLTEHTIGTDTWFCTNAYRNQRLSNGELYFYYEDAPNSTDPCSTRPDIQFTATGAFRIGGAHTKP